MNLSKIIKILTIVLLIQAYGLFAKQISSQECSLPDELAYAYASTERHMKRSVGYPYLISFNNKSDVLLLKKLMKKVGGVWLDNRTYDCKNESLCSKLTDVLVEKGFKNIDLGHMQICYRWHPMKSSNFFNVREANKKACNIIKNLVNAHGASWETLGKYHSFTSSKNSKYVAMLQNKIRNIKTKN